MRSAFVRGGVAVLVLLSAAPASAAVARPHAGEAAVVAAMNGARARYGLPALAMSARLSRAARAQSGAILRSGSFTHGNFAARIARFTTARSVGENLAWVRSCGGAAAQLVRMWLDSPPHRRILLSGGFRRVGVGMRSGRLNGGPACVVTADFASGG